jgi:hypothetical protein
MLKADFDLGPILSKMGDLEEKIKASIRPAAFAGSNVFYKEVRTRALTVGGSRSLQSAVYQKFVVDSASGATGESATYHISWRKQREKTNVKKASTGDSLPYSTIGFWIEFGRLQRYMVRTDKNGDWYTVARPGMKGKPKPGREASQATKDAYWMPRKDGPVFILPKSFLRSSYEAKKGEAVKAVQDRMKELMKEALR